MPSDNSMNCCASNAARTVYIRIFALVLVITVVSILATFTGIKIRTLYGARLVDVTVTTSEHGSSSGKSLHRSYNAEERELKTTSSGNMFQQETKGASAPTRTCDDFGLARYYDNHMVLQRTVDGRGAVVWGYTADIGDRVTIHIEELGVNQETIAYQGESGRVEWRVTLQVEEGGPYRLDFRSEDCHISLENVLFGDVWFCSGQSNMVHRLERLDNPEPDLNDIENFPNVRTFMTRLDHRTSPEYDLVGVQRSWAVPTRVRTFSAICWLFGKQLFQLYNRPIGLVQAAWGGTRIEAWSSPYALDICYPAGPRPGASSNRASALWNSMVHPFLPMSITGALWYQGESNSGQLVEYECAFREMVAEWRRRWGLRSGGNTDPRFPFGQVQLAPWRDDANRHTGFPEVRWAQAGYQGNTPNDRLPGVFMAVAVDLPDFSSPWGSIHPRYKRQIADRLVLGARALAYNETVAFQGPLPASYTFNGAVLTMEYQGEIDTRDTDRNYYFEACCSADTDTDCLTTGAYTWQPAPIVGRTGKEVMVESRCREGHQWVGVRYLWRESPCHMERCPVYAADSGLPGPPFIKAGLQN